MHTLHHLYCIQFFSLHTNKVNADMIAIMTEQESSFSTLIMGTFAQQMLSQSTIPVLTVRPRKVLADTANY